MKLLAALKMVLQLSQTFPRMLKKKLKLIIMFQLGAIICQKVVCINQLKTRLLLKLKKLLKLYQLIILALVIFKVKELLKNIPIMKILRQ